jgi:hypothetical protein
VLICGSFRRISRGAGLAQGGGCRVWIFHLRRRWFRSNRGQSCNNTGNSASCSALQGRGIGFQLKEVKSSRVIGPSYPYLRMLRTIPSRSNSSSAILRQQCWQVRSSPRPQSQPVPDS